jgi:hypothetical protein
MIDWSKQHCGMHQAPIVAVYRDMSEVGDLIDETFPKTENVMDFSWDIKVHMLMPRQYPCIPGWHVDNVPRDEDGRQMFDKVRLDLPMYMWISGGPLTQFRTGYIKPEKWVKFTQACEHRGQAASEFTWRGFIRATHKDILPVKQGPWVRRHCTVYVDEVDYQW